ncbi:MAG: hydroxymethylbilane synthase [Proteobacteria bacterium]|nr:hydroxymethylbilane synthase [Pseudomonadota bacterium]MCK4866607.1 hydroxymethylbilane synthase [Alphaproteobacteria bacterium]
MTISSPDLKIGTRGSPLALVQAHEVRDRLLATHDGLSVEIVIISTTGDQVQDRRLAEVGGKGLFTKEIQEALIDGRIDLAVHSMKDVETWLPDETTLAVVLEREDPRDAFLSPRATTLDELPAGAAIGTSSLRRQAQILHRRPDLRVEMLRGNVQTRLRKLEEGVCDATLLALAGLKRLGNEGLAQSIIETDVILPAVAQGVIGLETRREDSRVLDLVASLNHAPTWIRVTAERAMLAALDGSCHTPIGGLAELSADGRISLTGLIAMPDGSQLHKMADEGPAGDPEALGTALGQALRARMPADFFT